MPAGHRRPRKRRQRRRDDGDGDPGDGDPGDGDPGDGDPGDGDGDPGLCGNAAVDPGEDCDDANGVDFDGCDNDCSYTQITVVAGGVFTCAVLEGGAVRCWGDGSLGSTGYGQADLIGDDEPANALGDVMLPWAVDELALGNAFACGFFIDNELRCWGGGGVGQLGNGSPEDLGDDETLANLPAVDFANTVTSFASGNSHSCASFDDGSVRCWGLATNGRLGEPMIGENIGDTEPASGGLPVDVGGVAASFVATGPGSNTTCVVNVNNEVYCWGRNDRGQCGYGTNQDIGDTETPASKGPVSVHPQNVAPNTAIDALALGKDHSCVLFASGQVLCWGRNQRSQLGQGNISDYGTAMNELPSGLDALVFPSTVSSICAGEDFTCARLADGAVRCWGYNTAGQLGRGDVMEIDTPGATVPVDLGQGVRAVQISCGRVHACAVTEDNEVYCWGDGAFGKLGYGSVDNIGDTEPVSSVAPVQIFDP